MPSAPSTAEPWDGQRNQLRAMVDLVVPADDHPSAGQAGSLDFLARYLGDRPDLRGRLTDLVRRFAAGPAGSSGSTGLPDEIAQSEDWRWFAGLVNAGYYGDPGNGGNAGAASWRMVGWSPGPAQGWSRELPIPEPTPATVQPGELEDRYDTIVIGSGPGGGVAACLLAESGRRVLIVEAGTGHRPRHWRWTMCGTPGRTGACCR